MAFEPHIKNRAEHTRICNCGKDHKVKIIRGLFHYAEERQVGFCAALLEHSNERHVWLSFITGEWPGTNQSDCYVTSDIWCDREGRIMKIEDSASSPFTPSEVFECYPVSREQVFSVDGAKDWFIKTYLQLFEADKEIGGYLEACA